MRIFSFGAVCDTVIVGNGIRYEGQYPCGEGVLYWIRWAFISAISERGHPQRSMHALQKNGHRYYGEFKDGEYSGRGYTVLEIGMRYASVISKRTLFWKTDTIWYKSLSMSVSV